MNREITFGQIVKERRNHLGLTQTELARRVSCAPVTIRKIEYDALRPSVQIAERLAVALNIPEAEHLAFVRLARQEPDPSPIPTPAPAPEEIGQQDLSGRAIKGFELGERIGAGGYGAVYRAVQATVEREVAIKIILPKYANQPEFIRRFEAEAQLVARLEHPHIVPLYDYWREPGVAYLVMRFLRGGSLEARLKAGPLPPETTLHILEQICAGLHAAHRAGVIHRDIKPANVLLDEDGNAYLADFGIAKNLHPANGGGQTSGEIVIGSSAYISPEQILAEPVKPQSDIYSLGVMLYELLTARKPFKGPTPVAYIQQHLNEQLPLIAAQQTSEVSKTSEVSAKQAIPTPLDIVIGRATAKDPRERYPDVLSLLADIRRAMAPESTVADIADAHAGLTTPPHVAAMIDLPELANPYKGLRAFGEADAANFFGRDTLIQALLIRMAEESDLSRFLAVVGPSGSGKSSAVKAGLIPALRQGGLPDSDKWFIVEMTPGTHPLEELETALLRVAANPPDSLLAQLRENERGLHRAVNRILPADGEIELVLVIDQFEEIFTLVEDEELRAHFLNSLVTAVLDPRSRVRIVVTLRADFTDRPLQYVDFGELVRQQSEFVLPLTPDELEQAITGPTKRAGLSLEAGLVSTIIDDIGDQPGMLPLLQYALTELFERRQGRKLTLAAYRDSGGVLGALARRAEELYAGLDEAGREAARQLFLRLVTLGEGLGDTRRRVLRSELEALTPTLSQWEREQNLPSPSGRGAGGEGEIASIIDAFGRYRLLTFDHDPVTRGPTVEVAHESLLREWSRLRGWLDESRADIRLQRLLAADTQEWLQAGQNPGFLLRGSRLDQFEHWATGAAVALTQNERVYLEASLLARQARQAEERARHQRELETAQKLAETESRRAEEQARAAQRLRRRALFLTGALVIAGVLAVVAILFGQQATQNERQALAEANNRATAQAIAVNNLALSESQRLAAEANAILQGGSAELAALLSLRALNTAYTTQADIALQHASTGYYGRRLFTGHTGSVTSLAFSSDGAYTLSGGADNTARLWDLRQTGQVLQTFTGHTGVIWSVALSPDGNYALTGSEDGTARLWDLRHTGREVQTLTGHTSSVESVAFSPDGIYALTGSWDGTARLWDVKTGREVRIIEEGGSITTVAFSPDGQQILTGNMATNEVRLWSVTTGRELRRFAGPSGGVNSVAFSPDGRYILAGDGDSMVHIWDLQATNAEPRLFTGHTEVVYDLEVSPDGRYALSASWDNTARLWDIETGDEVRRFVHSSHADSATFSPNGQMILIGTEDGAIRLWDIQPPPDPHTLSGHTGIVQSVEFSPDGRYILTSGADQTARLWETATGRELRVLRGHTDWVSAAAFSPDGRYVLTSGNFDQTARLWNVETGREVRVFTHPVGVIGVAYSPDGHYIATGADDMLARLWDVETGREVRRFRGHTSGVTGLVFSPDGHFLLTSSAPDATSRLWDVETGQEVRQFPDYGGYINGLAYSPDGNYILTAAPEYSTYLWDLRQEGEPLQRFSGDNGAFSLDGKYILTGGLKTAYLWDRATGRQLRAFGVDKNLWAVAISPDSRYVLIGGSTQTAQLWDTDYHTLMDSVCARVLRDFTDKEREQYGINDQQPTCPAKD